MTLSGFFLLKIAKQKITWKKTVKSISRFRFDNFLIQSSLKNAKTRYFKKSPRLNFSSKCLCCSNNLYSKKINIAQEIALSFISHSYTIPDQVILSVKPLEI